MECDEITKLVDGVYKNILEKFNPGTRQFIAAGKGYLKALHGAAAASRLFNESLAKIALNAQQSGTGDIGAALLNVVAVYKEIQEQQMNILKAFYVDLLVPLETNLEKDTKVVQHEQKKFMQQYKVRIESYQKAVSTMKKQRKKKASPENTEKELRSLQILEDQKRKLDAFCEQSYKNAMTQERRRYGFVLERQCSIAKHWMAYHTTGRQAIDTNIENWLDVAASREMIPTNGYEAGPPPTGRMERFKESREEPHYRSHNNTSSQLKKSRSVDAPYGDIRTMHLDHPTASYAQNSLPRAKSDFNLTTATTATLSSSNDHSDHGQWGDQRPVVKALYAYMPSGENQLPFEEGDRIALVGSKAKGWQFGENLRTQMFGWFPIAYTNFEGAGGEKSHSRSGDQRNSSSSYENLEYDRHSNGDGGLSMRATTSHAQHSHPQADHHHGQYMRGDMQMDSDTSTFRRRNHSATEESSSPTRMFGDTMNLRNQKKYRASSGANPRPGPPPTLPAPVPSVANYNRSLNSSQSFCAPNGGPAGPSAVERRKHKLQNGQQQPQQQPPNTSNAPHSSMSQGSAQTKSSAAAKTSLHSSNDSGFANEPPPQPEIDYSDDEQTNRVPIRRRADTNTSHMNRSDVVSWTLNRNFRNNSVDSHIDDKSLNAYGKPMRPTSMTAKMRYDLIASDDEILQGSSGGIKRTKSFWKFGGGRGGDHILEGMSLWQHRDLVTAPNVEALPQQQQQQPQPQQQQSQQQQPQVAAREIDLDQRGSGADGNGGGGGSGSGGGGTLTKANANMEKRTATAVDDMPPEYDDEENIYVMSPATVARPSHHAATPKSRMKIMKTIAIDIEKPLDQEYSVSRSTTMQRDRDSTLRKQNKSYKQQQQQQQSADMMMSAMMQSTEDEGGDGDSDDDDDDDVGDNGTLKMSDINNFFDDLHQHDHAMMMERGNGNGAGRAHALTSGGGMIMKTVKRKDILKQYYTSEDDTDAEGEIKSTSSDPYDCIVINDHLVRKDEKHRSQHHHQQQQQQQQHQQQQSRHKSHATYQERHEVELKTFRAPPVNSNANTSTAKKPTKEGKMSKQQQQQQQQQFMDNSGDDSNRYSKNSNHMASSSTLTRNSTASGSANNASMNSTPTATILPRTRLMKSSTTMTLERQQVKSQQQHQQTQPQRQNDKGSDYIMEKDLKNYGNTYGPWYDFWDQQDQSQQQKQQQQQRQHNVTSQKSMRSSKMK